MLVLRGKQSRRHPAPATRWIPSSGAGSIPAVRLVRRQQKGTPMLNAFQKAAKYAGLDDGQVVAAVDTHPAIETAMAKLNEDFARADVSRDDLIEHDANGMA